MIITSAQYYKDGFGNIGCIMATIDEQEVSVPIDTSNRHYLAILEWAEEDGNEIAAAD
jgi:imidazoleglycerol phosphate dehydratase HisB